MGQESKLQVIFKDSCPRTAASLLSRWSGDPFPVSWMGEHEPRPVDLELRGEAVEERLVPIPAVRESRVALPHGRDVEFREGHPRGEDLRALADG